MKCSTAGLIVTLILLLLAAPRPFDAQQARKIPRIGEVDDGRGGGTRVQSVTWKGPDTFPMCELADERAFAKGKRWVDERG
jgi:hypothetical protein